MIDNFTTFWNKIQSFKVKQKKDNLHVVGCLIYLNE